MAKTLWIISFKLKKGITTEQFIAATKLLHDNVLSKAKGFISWEQYLQKDTWSDIVAWETEEDANNALTIGEDSDEAAAFYAMLQMQTCRLLVSKQVIKY